MCVRSISSSVSSPGAVNPRHGGRRWQPPKTGVSLSETNVVGDGSSRRRRATARAGRRSSARGCSPATNTSEACPTRVGGDIHEPGHLVHDDLVRQADELAGSLTERGHLQRHGADSVEQVGAEQFVAIASRRSRCVAATNRTSALRSRTSPMRRKRRSSRTLPSRLGWTWTSMSPISEDAESTTRS